MPARKKIVSHPAQVLRDSMVANLSAAIGRSYPGVSVTNAYEKIQSRTGISLSSLQRIMSGDTGPSIDTLADLAHHLGTTVSEMLTINMDESIDPRPPATRRPRELQRRRAE